MHCLSSENHFKLKPKANTKVICKHCKVMLGETMSSEEVIARDDGAGAFPVPGCHLPPGSILELGGGSPSRVGRHVRPGFEWPAVSGHLTFAQKPRRDLRLLCGESVTDTGEKMQAPRQPGSLNTRLL
ncbi:E3 Ubiquitin-Protein Ligase E3D [Manis pentadactyla]|nr:E3 Ubiquitin-Protein Ligase E3D [Manis pentadactyla]